MLEIEKVEIKDGYDIFNIKTEEGTFEISYQRNLDLYWRYIYQGSILTNPDSHTFVITKENYFAYQLFDNLYQSIKNGNPFEKLPEEESLWSLTGKESKNIRKEESRQRLFKNRIIDWHSDDSEYDKASRLLIKKEKDKYQLTFIKSKEDLSKGQFMSFAIRFSNSGSRYHPYNFVFMNMYQALSQYDPNNRQIHMEEFLYNQKKLRKTRKK